MWENSEKFSKLRNNWKKLWKNEIIDIILFGSSVKGKPIPNDIDICLIFRKEINQKITEEIQKLMGEKYHISTLTIDNFFTNPHSLAKTILLEGTSIITKNPIAENFNLKTKVIYTYDISKEKPSKKVRFVQLLRGRNSNQGLMKSWQGEFLANNSFIISIEKDSETQAVLAKWQIKYKRIPILTAN